MTAGQHGYLIEPENRNECTAGEFAKSGGAELTACLEKAWRYGGPASRFRLQAGSMGDAPCFSICSPTPIPGRLARLPACSSSVKRKARLGDALKLLADSSETPGNRQKEI